MRYSQVIVVLLVVIAGATAQRAPMPSGIVVLESKWRGNAPAPQSTMLETDPFEPAQEATQLQQDRKDTIRENEARKQLGLPPVPLPSTVTRRPATSAYPIPPPFLYSVKIRNAAPATIAEVVWDYVFLDDANQEVGRHSFTSHTRLATGKTTRIMELSYSAPVLVINAADPKKSPASRRAERIDIRIVRYTDGSVWNAEPK